MRTLRDQRPSSVSPPRSSATTDPASHGGNSQRITIEKTKDPNSLMQENRTLKVEKEQLLNKYENKLIDLKGFIRALLNSVDKLLTSPTIRSIDNSLAISLLEKDRKQLAEALVKYCYSFRRLLLK